MIGGFRKTGTVLLLFITLLIAPKIRAYNPQLDGYFIDINTLSGSNTHLHHLLLEYGKERLNEESYAQIAATVECGSIPTDGCRVTQDTTFVKDTYNLVIGIYLDNNNIILDCNGATLVGTGAMEGGSGINSYEGRYPQYSTIKNCILKSYTTSIWVKGSHNNINSNEISNTLIGIYIVPDSEYNLISNNDISSARTDGIVVAADNNHINSNNLHNNDATGIGLFGSNNQVNSNTVCSSTYFDFYMDPEATNTGNNNRCDKIYNWNDEGTSGCTYSCGTQQCAGTDISCGTYPNCINCNNQDGCSGNYYRNYYCVSNSQGCSYTSDNCNDCSCSCGGYNIPETTANGNCNDGKDNDCDGYTDSADSGCVTCECSSGICCDGCHYRSSSYVCDYYYSTDYGCPWGTSCGNDVGVRYKKRYCSGSSSSCTGAISDWGSWSTYDYCTSTERCADDDSTCNYDASCAQECTPGTTCCDNSGHYRPYGYDCGTCKACNGAGSCSVKPTDDSDCGIISCGDWHHIVGSASPTDINYCYDSPDITSNRCKSFGSCKDANTADCGTLDDTQELSCGVCKYVAGCSGTTDGYCANYAEGTYCGENMECDGEGNCVEIDVPVVLVHGYAVIDPLDEIWQEMKNWFENDDYKVYVIDLEKSRLKFGFSNGDIKDYAKKVEYEIKKIKEETNKSKVDIVAHDMGGLATRWYINKLGGEDIRKLVMIGTQNHGSWEYALSIPFFVLDVFKEPIKKYLEMEGLNPALVDWSSIGKNILGDSVAQMIPFSPFLVSLNHLKDNSYSWEDVIAEGVDHFNLAGNKSGYCIYIHPTSGKIFECENDLLIGEDDTLVTVKSVNLDHVYLSKFYYNHTELPHKYEIYNKVKDILEGDVQSISSFAVKGLQQLQEPLIKEQEIISISGILHQGNEISNEISIDNFDYVQFILGHYPAEIDMELIMPNGSTITNNNINDYGAYFNSMFLMGYYISDPIVGKWTVNITGLNVSQYGVAYTLQAFTKSNLTLELKLNKYHYNLNEQINITAELKEILNPITGVTVIAKIKKPNDSIEILQLYDDGTHNDLISDDGIYNNFYANTDIYGRYDITITANGTKEGSEFSREDFVSVWVEDYPDLIVKNISFSNPSPTERDTIAINALIENIGEKEAINATIEFYHSTEYEDEFIGEDNIDVGIGESVMASVDWINLNEGNYNITVLISPFNSFLESNYSNNKLKEEISVYGLPTVTIISPVNNTTYRNSSVDLNWTVDKDTSWCVYSLDGEVNTTITGGNVECWGYNRYGQSNPYYGSDAIQVDTSDVYTCILKSNGNVECRGGGDSGELNPYNNGDAIQLSIGAYHNCILKSNGNVECWGWNYYGQLINYTKGDAIQVSAGGLNTCILKSNGNVKCWGNNDDGQSNPYNKGDAIQVSAGGDHTCILKSNGNVECWGWNYYGQLINYTKGDAIQVSASGLNTCILKSNGNIECWGRNDSGQSNPYNKGDAIQVSASGLNTCILKSNGNIECWGNNGEGQSNPYNKGDAIQVSAGGYHTCAVTHLKKNVTITQLSEAPHNITLYCRDLEGKIGQSDYVYFTVEMGKIISLPLTKGWDLISIPLKLEDNIVGKVFENISYSKIFAYNGTWLYYYNETNNNFNKIDETKAYWINSLNNQTLIIEGTEFNYPINFILTKGWNLISYPSLNESLINETLKDINYSIVYGYNGTWSSYIPSRNLNTLRYFVPSYGYWVKIPENVTLDFGTAIK